MVQRRDEPAQEDGLKVDCRCCGATNRVGRRRLDDMDCWFCHQQVTDAGFRKHGAVVGQEEAGKLFKGLLAVLEKKITPYACISAFWKLRGRPYCPESCPKYAEMLCAAHGRGMPDDPAKTAKKRPQRDIQF